MSRPFLVVSQKWAFLTALPVSGLQTCREDYSGSVST